MLPTALTVIELLISLALSSLSIITFGILSTTMLHQERNTYYHNLAVTQLNNMAERLMLSTQYQHHEIAVTSAEWHEENNRLLPQGQGSVTGYYPDYQVSLCWHAVHNNAKDTQECIAESYHLWA